MEQSQKRNGKKGRGSQPQPEAIAKNQVRNPRLAARKFEHKPAKRAAASPVPCSGQAANYGQCGGIGYTGPSCCSLGWTCQYSNDYYSQCVPAPTTCSNAFGGQCGGLSWTGDTCCPIGSACIYSNDYYSQCIVGATPTTTKTTPTSTAASTTATSTTQIIPTTSLTTSTTKPPTTSSTAASTSARTSSSIPTSTSTTKTSTTSLTTTSTSTSASPSATCNLPVIGAYGQCGGTGYTGLSCCVAGYTCVVSNSYYAQCVPTPLTVSSTTLSTTSMSTSSSTTKASTSTTKTPTTTTSSALPTSTCAAGGGGSDGCTPYSVSGLGLTLPLFVTFPSGGHVNYQAIACSQYTPGETYLRPGSDWTPVSFGMQFDPNIGQPGAVYIGKSFFDWGQASAYFGVGGFCVTWVQSSQYNQHFGEGGQAPVCSLTCLK